MAGKNNMLQSVTSAVPTGTFSPTASSLAGWDTSSNLSGNNLLNGYTTTVTAASTTTLTVASTGQQYFTGSTTQTVALPVTSTLVLGQSFAIVNLSSGVVTVQSSGGNTVQAMAANTILRVTCILTSGTSAASWNVEYDIQISITLPLSLANGGTNASLISSNGGIFYSTATAGAILSGTATANQVLLSGSSAAPAWSTATYLPTLTANGILYASATNTLAQITTAANGVLITSNSSVPSLLANSGTPGFVLTANSGAPPSWQAASGGGLSWSTVTGATQAAAINNGYIINGSGCTITLPATAPIGSVVNIKGLAGAWILTANTGQTIYFGATTSSSGGTATSSIDTDSVQVVCVVADTTWSVDYSVSNDLTLA